MTNQSKIKTVKSLLLFNFIYWLYIISENAAIKRINHNETYIPWSFNMIRTINTFSNFIILHILCKILGMNYLINKTKLPLQGIIYTPRAPAKIWQFLPNSFCNTLKVWTDGWANRTSLLRIHFMHFVQRTREQTT